MQHLLNTTETSYILEEYVKILDLAILGQLLMFNAKTKDIIMTLQQAKCTNHRANNIILVQCESTLNSCHQSWHSLQSHPHNQPALHGKMHTGPVGEDDTTVIVYTGM